MLNDPLRQSTATLAARSKGAHARAWLGRRPSSISVGRFAAVARL